MSKLPDFESASEEDIGDVKKVVMAQEADVKLAGMWATVVTILKTMIGVGVLGLPYAFRTGGWLFSIFCFPLIAVSEAYCMVALIKAKESAHLSRTTTPADVGDFCFGAKGRIVVGVVLCLDAIGICLSYFIFITYNMYLLTNVRQEIWAVIFFFFFLFASYIRPVKFISFLTLVANSLTLAGIIVTLIAAFVAAKPTGEPHLFNWSEFPIFLGIVLFAFQAIEMALPAHNMLRNQRRFTVSVGIVLSVVCVAYLFFGLAIYLRLADNSLSMITEVIDVFAVQAVVAILFSISLCVNVMCTIYGVYQLSDRLSCATRFRKISAKERARILAENEGESAGQAALAQVQSETQINPLASVSPNVPIEPNQLNGSPDDEENERGESGTDRSRDSSASASSSADAAVVPVSRSADSSVGAEGVEDDDEPKGFFAQIWANKVFWILSTIGRAVVLLIVAIPSLTPVREQFADFLGLSGCSTGVIMNFLLPMIAQLKIQWKTLPLWQKILDIVIICISVPAMVAVFVVTLLDLIAGLRDA